ncbi:MAG TPA: hypothetical protein PKM22_10780, partial [Candidatus Hydrogenedentes bacterium]|nr:hypothetical protein [Candidatus Hydrogenedentota bacterium]
HRDGELPNGLSTPLQYSALFQHIELDAVKRRFLPAGLIAAAQMGRHVAKSILFPEPHRR